jgi:hypothetical protein
VRRRPCRHVPLLPGGGDGDPDLLLVSGDADFVTGVTIDVTGGV